MLPPENQYTLPFLSLLHVKLIKVNVPLLLSFANACLMVMIEFCMKMKEYIR